MTQISDKTARSVSMKEFGTWIKENLHKTWYLGEGGAFSKEGRAKGGSPQIKYFYPSIDTRTMDIYHIKTNYHEVDFREEFPGTILDLLEHKVKEGIHYGVDPYYEDQRQRARDEAAILDSARSSKI